MEPHVARLVGSVAAVLCGVGLAAFLGRRDRLGSQVGLIILVQGVLLFAASLGGPSAWLLLVLVVGAVMATLATAAMAPCAAATGSADIADWTPATEPVKGDDVDPMEDEERGPEIEKVEPQVIPIVVREPSGV